jgi:apolipoprotein N-acyltransferase
LFRISIFEFRIFPDWYRSTFGQALAGGLLLWAALPPLDIWPLAWIAPVWWVLLIRRQKLPLLRTSNRSLTLGPWKLLAAAVLYYLGGLAVTAWFHSMQYRLFFLAEIVFWLGLAAIFMAAARRWADRPYRSLWLAGTFFWLAALHWLRLPYWAIGFGWLAAGLYFGCYFPVFVSLSRVGVHRLRLPLILVAPMVYTGMELAQAHLLSGMTMGCLEHTQYRFTTLIQISDMTGCYGVTFLMMFVAACLAQMLPCDGRPWAWWPLAPAVALLAAVLVYGDSRTAHVATDPGLKMALIQGNIDIQLDGPRDIRDTTDTQYCKLTREALINFPEFDLIVWPETVFCRENWVTGDADAKVPDGFPNSPPEFQERLAAERSRTQDVMTDTAREFRHAMIVGVQQEHYGRQGRETFNSAVLITPDGRWCEPDHIEHSCYDKMHLVPFGEFMPFAKSFPWLQTISPLGAGTTPGEQPKCFMFNNICLVPNICYETVLPYVIRNQLVTLREQGMEPKILVNVTNDGWFWGSSELEQHLACGVYRAVESRLPLVIAANTGISASIDASGHIVQQGPRHDTQVMLADVRLDRRESWYLHHGDWFGGTCLLGAIFLGCVGAIRRT